jgi:NADH dehydrogenase
MILITGSSGFIGTNLVRELSKENKLRCIVRKKNQEPINNVELFYADLLNKDLLEEAFQGVNTVIHLAALTEGKPKKILETNIQGTKNLIELSKKYNIKRFILLSSDNVILKNKGPYASSKSIAEEIVINSELNHIILRPNWVYDYKGNKDLKNIISLVKKTKIVPIIGNGEYKLQPIHVKDLIFAIKQALTINENKIYHLGGSEEITFNELIDEISKYLNLKRKKLHLSTLLMKLLSPISGISKGRITEIIQDKISNNKEAIQDFNFNPVSIQESLEKMLK